MLELIALGFCKAQVFVAIFTMVMLGIFILQARFKQIASFGFLLKLNHWMLVGSLVIPLFLALLPVHELALAPSTFMAETVVVEILQVDLALKKLEQMVELSIAGESHYFLKIVFGIILLGLGIFAGRLIYADMQLRRLTRSSTSIGSFKAVNLLVNESINSPVSFFWRAQKYILMPTWLITDRDNFNISMQHEMQHHRQGDTATAYLWLFARSLFFLNPFIYIWSKGLNGLQEFACDETLIGRKGVSAFRYGSCLLKVAEKSLEDDHLPVGATGMAVSASAKTLKRRVKFMFVQPRKFYRMISALGISMICLMTIVSVAMASMDLFRDRAMSMAEVQNLVEGFEGSGEFPIEVNQEILEQLNKYIGTPEGRQFVRSSTKRMRQNLGIYEGKLAEYKMPVELLAVALMESGFKNLDERQNVARGAGVWQFIPTTARRFGLEVNEQVDERLDISKETDAAMRYLSRLQLQFADWRLAMLAYNCGERRLHKRIMSDNTRDPWKLVRNGHPGDQSYLAKVMAGVIILKSQKKLL